MAQVNRNFAYLTDVDGLTIWERLRVIRGFLLDRQKALKVAEISEAKFEEEKLTMDKWELAEAEVMRSDYSELIQDCRDEIEYLVKLEKRLAEAAEPLRVKGKSDREMYELNYPEEARARTIEQAKADVMAFGNISSDTAKRFLRDPIALTQAFQLGLIKSEVYDNLMRLEQPSAQNFILSSQPEFKELPHIKNSLAFELESGKDSEGSVGLVDTKG